jgi:uncharacterized membrane protein YdjX (TVP38/TMEM64 family)
VSGTATDTQSPTKQAPEEVEEHYERSGAPALGRGWLVAILAVVGTFALVCLLSLGIRSDLGELAALVGALDAAAIKDWILSFGAWAPFAYFLIVVGQVIANPIPAGPVTLAGALLFGVPTGLALSIAGSVVGSALVFVAVRRWGEPLVTRLVGKETFYKYSSKLNPKGWWLFVVLLLPFMPDDAVCAVAGLSAVTFRRFLVMMVVGRLPGATLTALLASDIVTGSAAAWITVGLVVAVVMALGFAHRERLEGWVLRRAEAEEEDPGRKDGT